MKISKFFYDLWILFNGHGWVKLAKEVAYCIKYAIIYFQPSVANKLQEIAEETFKEHSTVDKVTVSLYKEPGYGYGETIDDRRTLWWEAPLTVTVWINGYPAFGMAVEFNSKFVCIRQLQGVRGAQVPKDLHKWPQIFVEVCKKLVSEIGWRGVRIYRADQNRFYKKPFLTWGFAIEKKEYEAIVKKHKPRMRRRYDGTARQLGFDMKKRYGVWTNPDYA
ncbi:hypothetical protein ACFL6I_23700 [candidate division KSB1 bacterium]